MADSTTVNRATSVKMADSATINRATSIKMTDSATVNRTASAMNMNFLDFGSGYGEVESGVFHGSPFFEWVGWLPKDTPSRDTKVATRGH
jgi:hypothetical protein